MKTTTTVIVGAGQSGLAMSRELSRRGVDHLILDRGAVANAWRSSRWDSLRLLTPNWANGLPGKPYKGPHPDGYMSVKQLISRLETYAGSIDAPVQEHTEVQNISGDGGGYLVTTSQGPIRCKTLVLASGACARPHIPAISEYIPSNVFQITPSQYKRVSDLPGGSVLVVGASATGVQLAREIQLSGHRVTLAVGWHTRLPRTYRGQDIERWFKNLGLLEERYDDVDDLNRVRRTPSPQLIGGPDPVDLNALQALGIRIVGRLADIRDGYAVFSGGLANTCVSADLKMHRFIDAIDKLAIERCLDHMLPPGERLTNTRIPNDPLLRLNLSDGSIRTVVWATGYQPEMSWLQLPVFDRRGRLRHDGGVVPAPGLYAMGLTFMRRRSSHQISGVGKDAHELSSHLQGYLDNPAGVAA